MIEAILRFISTSFTPESTATYIVGAAAVFGGLSQLRRNLTLNKKANVFEELSSKIAEAKSLLSEIDNEAGKLIDLLAQEANAASAFAESYPTSDATTQTGEINRRIEKVNEVAGLQRAHLSAIYDAQRNIITLIEQIDKSTVISKNSKRAAKYVYFAATDQHELASKAKDVIISLNVLPMIDSIPNIDPSTFRSIVELYAIIRLNYREVANYLDDLEVILHNDLVRGIFSKAQYAQLHDKTLTINGIIDHRAEQPLR